MRPSLQPETARFWMWVIVAALVFSSSPVYAASCSDRNGDGVVDVDDIKLFSTEVLGQDWQTVDWCQWAQDGSKYHKKCKRLVAFIWEYFQCDDPPPPPPPPRPDDPLAVKNENLYPTRLAFGPDGKLYVSDAKIGSVFIYDVTTDTGGQTTLDLTGELKRLGRIVAVAVDDAGLVYVGNSQQSRVETYNLQGEQVGTIGESTLRMPTDMTFDADNNLYVADSRSDVVWVYRPDGTLLRTIRRGGLDMPMAVEIAYRDDGTGELYVGDKATHLVKVFDLQGNLLRSFGGIPTQGMMGWKLTGKFVSLQSLAVDQHGDLHALDSYMNQVQIFDPVTGIYLSTYGQSGTAPGELKLPLDIIISNTGKVVVANTDNRRVEVIHTIP